MKIRYPGVEKISDPRLQDFWQPLPFRTFENIKVSGNPIVVASYPDDEGIRLNRGRPGAHEGPSRIRHYLGRMVLQPENSPLIYILEDTPSEPSLAERHRKAEERIAYFLERGFRVLTIGGGHDYGFPDAAAFYKTQRGKILNIDAHLDMRPVMDGKLNSGTPFFRFAEEFGGKPLIQWGIQSQCNSSTHLAYAKKKGAQVFDFEAKLPRIGGKVGLSICLDAFQGIRGVSAPAVVGLDPRAGIKAIHTYGKAWMGIYECAPNLDPGHEDSARLGALFAYHFIHSKRARK